jgi:hypothetical protein
MCWKRRVGLVPRHRSLAHRGTCGHWRSTHGWGAWGGHAGHGRRLALADFAGHRARHGHSTRNRTRPTRFRQGGLTCRGAHRTASLRHARGSSGKVSPFPLSENIGMGKGQGNQGGRYDTHGYKRYSHHTNSFHGLFRCHFRLVS